MSPLKDVEVLTTHSVTVNVTLFENTVFADDRVKIRSLEWVLIHYDCVFIKRDNLNRDRQAHRENTM